MFLYGPRMKWLQDELRARGFAGQLEHFETHAAMVEALRRGFKPGDVMIVKGSRGMRMEEVWKPFREWAATVPRD